MMVDVTDAQPRITISYAQSLDGRIATITGSSRWISGGATLTLAHRLRRDSDAVLVGIGTVLADDPELTCRLDTNGNVAPSGGTIVSDETPARIIVDSRLHMQPESRLAQTAKDIPTYVLCDSRQMGTDRARSMEHLGLRLVGMTADGSGHFTPMQIVEWIVKTGFQTLLVEGGRQIVTTFLRAGQVDRMVVVTAPIIIGEGISAIGDLGVTDLKDALWADSISTRRVGQDMVWDLRFHREG